MIYNNYNIQEYLTVIPSLAEVSINYCIEQLTREGGYTGGTPPYGYKLCKMGLLNKRNHEVYDLVIDEHKSEVIKEIFSLYLQEDINTH